VAVGTCACNAVLDPMIAAQRANDLFILFRVVGSFGFFDYFSLFIFFRNRNVDCLKNC
jgi:hypothetical protein